MNRLFVFTVPALLIGAATYVQADTDPNALVVTASNTAANQLLVYDTAANLVQTISTQGHGGVSGNAGGIAARDSLVAVVNFGSKSVSIFQRVNPGFQLTQLVPALSNPVSVAFGHGHLYVLGTTEVESHPVFGSSINASPDGLVMLLHADGSSAQVGVAGNQLVITEKSNVIETVNLLDDGAVTGASTLVQNIPANVNAPFGLVTRGSNAYVTIAHADEIALVRTGSVFDRHWIRHSTCTVLAYIGGAISVFE